MKKIILSFFFSIALFIPLKAAAAHQDFSKLNELYRAENYEEAYKGYAAGLAKDRNNPKLWYNAGNALYRMNRLGDAVYAYSKSFLLNPRDGDVRFNLEYVMRQTGQAFVPEGTPKLLYVMFYLFSAAELKAIVIVLFWTTMLAACFCVMTQGKARRFSLRVMIIAFALLIANGGWAWARHYSQFSSSAAVITKPGGLKLFSGPGENFRECATAPEGRIVRILSGTDEKYYEIGLTAEGISGWALRNGVKKL